MKKIILSIICFTILLGCSDNNLNIEENIIDEDSIICENSNTKKLLTIQSTGSVILRYSYNNQDYLDEINIDAPGYQKSIYYTYNEENLLATKTSKFNTRAVSLTEIDSFQYNTGGELIKHQFKDKSYFAPDPYSEIIEDSSSYENNFVYDANLIKINSSDYIRLNEDKKIETIILDKAILTFQYDLNGNIISGTGNLNGKDINIRVSYECFIKHPIFQVHTFNHILISEYRKLKPYKILQSHETRAFLEVLVNLGFHYPSSIEWEITGEGNYKMSYEYDFDLEGYPEKKETIIYSSNSDTGSYSVYYHWED
ncbi:hypothetical protein [Aureibacter tunicatorum]|uniref:Uncharacterized protein n=1 Tax=Aureibacter tunicatorum TaxID=866807 RepID=A0AAE3XNZ2_9BACT|nr:hypothetical protein [Aureibacter tunicatorum]MDR6238594.1 hypothetical protein [Aureibacter tunicatorum]BDD05475.1 hypothetical protein AUTU_29580 [Aureibacter tunicatorum]